MNALPRRAAALALFVLCGCGGINVAARSSVSPVLFGPVRTLGGTREARGATAPVFERVKLEVLHDYQFGGDLNGNAFGSTHQAAASQLDWEVALATNGNLARRVEVTSLSCGGFVMFWLFATWDHTWCDVEGEVKGPAVTPLLTP
jgi:hypothetical protein